MKTDLIDHISFPSDIDAEQTLLGQLMASSALQVQDVRELLSERLFYSDKHRVIYHAVMAAVDAGEQPNLNFVWKHVEADTSNIKPTLAELAEICSHNAGTAIALPQYISLLTTYEQRRSVLRVGVQLTTSAMNGNEELDAVVSSAVEALQQNDSEHQRCIVTLQDVLKDINDIVVGNMQGGNVSSTLTGFPFIDQRGGFQSGNLIVIAGATSQGKTSFALSAVLNAVRAGTRIAFYSLEMTREQLAARLLSAESSLNAHQMLTSQLTTDEVKVFDKAVAQIWTYGDNLYFDDRSSSNIDVILNSIRSLKVRKDICGAVVDYLQILNVNQRGQQNREQIMGDVARRLKNLAKDLGIWIVALSQLNRNSDNPKPSLERLRDSGQIAEAADIVMTVYRPETYGRCYPKPFEHVQTLGTAMIDVCKGRNIGVGCFFCGFDAQRTLFYPLDELPSLPVETSQTASTNNLTPF